jgi:hypothetical protein
MSGGTAREKKTPGAGTEPSRRGFRREGTRRGVRSGVRRCSGSVAAHFRGEQVLTTRPTRRTVPLQHEWVTGAAEGGISTSLSEAVAGGKLCDPLGNPQEALCEEIRFKPRRMKSDCHEHTVGSIGTSSRGLGVRLVVTSDHSRIGRLREIREDSEACVRYRGEFRT